MYTCIKEHLDSQLATLFWKRKPREFILIYTHIYSPFNKNLLNTCNVLDTAANSVKTLKVDPVSELSTVNSKLHNWDRTYPQKTVQC